MMWFRVLSLASVLLGLGLASPAVADERHAGLARLIDGDTIEIDEQRIRLNGIDTPEPAQRCTGSNGKSYRCGKRATDALNQLIRGRPVVCIGNARDGYDRLIAECSVDAGSAGPLSLNREMVRLGWAVAFEKFTDVYLPEQLEAAKEARGIWRGPFQLPHEFRAERWKITQQKSPDGCPIKGNINAKGVRIYHTPWSQYYPRTKIDLSKGERWFCDEAEAIKAGWRAPYR